MKPDEDAGVIGSVLLACSVRCGFLALSFHFPLFLTGNPCESKAHGAEGILPPSQGDVGMCVLALGPRRRSISAPGPRHPSPVRLLWPQWTHGAGCLLSRACWAQTRDDPPEGSQRDGPIQRWREMGSLLVRESCTAGAWAWRYPASVQ